MVEVDGRLLRRINVIKTEAELRQARNKRYRPSDTWKKDNPDKVSEQKRRAADRDYHRPFIDIDAEGHNFAGEDIEYRGNIYPKHRTILWAVGGWRRLYSSTELANGVGLPTLGEECASYSLGGGKPGGPVASEAVPEGDAMGRATGGSEDKRALSSVEIIEWLLTLPGLYDKNHGFPDGVNFGAYAFNYDVTQILADFPRKKVWEIARKKSFKTGKRTKAPTLVGDYAIDYLKSKT